MSAEGQGRVSVACLASAEAPAVSSGHAPLLHILETSPFPIALVSIVGIVLLTTFAPSLVVGDTWLTLMAGREIVDHGLPHTEAITVLGQGATWTDQQWLAQLVFYGGARARAGCAQSSSLDILLVLLALSLVVGDCPLRSARRRDRRS